MSGETKFSVLVSLFNWMQKSKSSAVKRSKFRKFLDTFCKPCDYFSAIRLILPSLDRERGTYGLKESVLATCLVDALGMSRESEDAHRLFNWRRGGPKSGAYAGNFAMVATEVLQRRQGMASGSLTIKELNDLLDRLASAENRAEKTSVLSTLIKNTNAQEMKWIVMIILKDLKLGISEKSIFHEFHPDAEDLFNVTCDLKLVCERRLIDDAIPPTVAPDAPVRPVFLTKAQRQELALKRREEEVAAQRRRQEQLLSQNRPTEPPTSKPSDSDRRDRERERERDRERDRRERDREYERRNREREAREREEARERARLEKLAEREKDKELEAIKEQYLGSKKPKKRVIKPSEKFRFSFDWENTEDTSRDMNSLYQNPHEAQLLFGRGFRAGMDRREQKKLAAKNEKELREDIRRKEGVEEKPEEALAQKQKEEAANLYDTFDMRVDRHWSQKKLEEMTERDWRIFREDFNISYKGSKIPKPMRSWAESKLSPELLKAVERAKYTTPSPIQMAAIPLGLQQRDVIGIAETGSGKTAAFVLPMLTYISRLPPLSEENEAEGPYAVVMAPTRELAQQIEEETLKFAHYMGIKVVSIVGGQSIEEQGFKIRNGCEVVIATPGRLIDCLERRYAVLNQCNYVVLDEADRMIDMGFEPQVTGVLDAMPSSNLKPENEEEELDEKKIYRTTYMFSATMPPGVERLARKYLRNPVVVTIGTAGKTTDLISQHVIMMKGSEKFPKLQKLLDNLGDKTAIVFVNTKKNADTVAKNLDKAGYKVTTLHGGKSQDQREISLEGFRSKRYTVLVATDVAGRGIDIPDVAHVINYDMPGNIDMYTHRIGRTGRAGKTGVATAFLTLGDTDVFYDLKQMLIQSNSTVPPELARHEASKFKPGTIPDRPPRRNETLFAH